MLNAEEQVFGKDYYTVPKPLKFIFLGLGLVGIFFLKIIRPFFFVRFCLLQSERIGEVTSSAEMYLRWKADNAFPLKERHIFLSEVPANEQILKMFSRKARVVRVNKYFLWTYRKLVRQFPRSKLWMPPLVCSRKDTKNLYPRFNRLPVQLEFTQQEEQKGTEFLAKLNLPFKASFVCVHARDKAYLANIHQYREWTYHDYRDADIETYVPAMKYLTSQGVYVFRMGYKVEKKLKLIDPLIIDYANVCREDFADIYLSAHCKFFIASEGGLNWVPWAFNIPVAYSNGIPLDVGGQKPIDIYLPKKLWSNERKRILTFRELYALGVDKWFYTEQYIQAGIEIINNSPEEILGLTREINERLNGVWQTSPEDEELQCRYLETLPEYFRCQELPLPRMSAVFLRMNQQLLD